MDETYTAPSVVELGTVAELTLKTTTGRILDSNYSGSTSNGNLQIVS